ncbi:MAG: hypothetical protein ACR2RV_14355 [Verrucomicrobiales bacterium]
MAVAIGGIGAGLIVRVSGPSLWGWLVALPGVFLGLQVVGLPIVLMGGLLERARLVPAAARAQLHECVLVGVLLALTFNVLSLPLALWTLGFFTLMYTLRILCRKCWDPGLPKESAQ